MEYTGTDFLVKNGYKVGIVGGKHFTTLDGEYVEVKNGTNYEIFVGNSHSEGCSVDIAIDSHPVGEWILKGYQAFPIQRPANEEKNFTFYRVKQAPEGFGIEKGREENGLIECVFTPEANIPVLVSTRADLLEPIQFQLSPCALIRDVKFEAQRRLGLKKDCSQVLVRGSQILDDFDELRAFGVLDGSVLMLKKTAKARRIIARKSSRAGGVLDGSVLMLKKTKRARRNIARESPRLSCASSWLTKIKQTSLKVAQLIRLLLGFLVALMSERDSNNERSIYIVTGEHSGRTILNRRLKQCWNRALAATRNDVVIQPRDQSWRAGGTAFEGVSNQQLVQAPPIRVDPSRKVVLTLRLVAREDEEPTECTPLSTLQSTAA